MALNSITIKCTKCHIECGFKSYDDAVNEGWTDVDFDPKSPWWVCDNKRCQDQHSRAEFLSME